MMRGSFYPSGKGFYQEHDDYEGGGKIIEVIPLSIIKDDYKTQDMFLQ